MAVLVLYYYFHIVFILEYSISVFWKSKVLAYTVFETMIFLLPISGDHILSSSTKTFATDVIKCLIMYIFGLTHSTYPSPATYNHHLVKCESNYFNRRTF